MFLSCGATDILEPGSLHCWSFQLTLRHTTLVRTPLDKWSARRRNLYLIAHSTPKRQMSMPPAGFEPAIPASERPQTHASDRAADGIRSWLVIGRDVESNGSVIYIETLSLNLPEEEIKLKTADLEAEIWTFDLPNMMQPFWSKDRKMWR